MNRSKRPVHNKLNCPAGSLSIVVSLQFVENDSFGGGVYKVRQGQFPELVGRTYRFSFLGFFSSHFVGLSPAFSTRERCSSAALQHKITSEMHDG